MEQSPVINNEKNTESNVNMESVSASCSIEALEQAMVAGSVEGVTKAVRAIVNSRNSEDVKKTIDLLENELFRRNNYFLARFLFLLYDCLGVEHMARFYLQYCYDEVRSNEEYTALVNKYLLPLGSIEGNYFSYDGDYTYEYEGQKKAYGVHSFSNNIGLNLTLLVTPYGSLILDCGAKINGNSRMCIDKDELLAFLGVYKVSVDDIVGVLISHAHMDHYGSISTLLDIGISPFRIYTDSRTKELIKVVSDDRHIEAVGPVYSFFAANEKIKIKSYDNGHILGSQLFVISFDDKTIVYTGDFCLHNQQLVQGLDVATLLEDEFVKKGVDCLITESTYGDKTLGILPFAQAEKAFVCIVDKLINKGYKIFLPAFALGRSQEITYLLKNNHRLLLDGLSVKLTQAYEALLGKVIASANVKYSASDESKIENFDFNDIIIAGAGMISENSMSVKYIEELLNSRQKTAIIRTGHGDSNEDSYSYGVFRGWKKRGGLLLDISLSAHAEYPELISLIHSLKPKNIVAVHGPGIKYNLLSSSNEDLFFEFGYGDDSDESYASAALDSAVRITDVGVQSRWRNIVKIGTDCIKAGKSLNNSGAFHNAFRMLVKSINLQSEGQLLLDKMEALDTIEQLFEFLKATADNDFVL